MDVLYEWTWFTKTFENNIYSFSSYELLALLDVNSTTFPKVVLFTIKQLLLRSELKFVCGKNDQLGRGTDSRLWRLRLKARVLNIILHATH